MATRQEKVDRSGLVPQVADENVNCHSLGGVQQLLPPVQLGRVRALLPSQELRYGPGGELRLTDVAEVPGEVYGLPLHQAGQQGHVGRLPPSSWQGHTELVEFVPQKLPAVLGLRPPQDSTQERGIETLWGGQPPLDLRHGHLVLGGGGQQRQSARGGAEDV